MTPAANRHAPKQQAQRQYRNGVFRTIPMAIKKPKTGAIAHFSAAC